MMRAQMTRRERVMHTLAFEPVDRIATYDLLQHAGAIEHYAGEPLTIEDGDRIKGKAIGRCLDMTRHPYGPMRPRVERTPDGMLRQYEAWTSWIIERPFKVIEELIPWVRRRIEQLNASVPDASYVREHHTRLRQFMEYFAAGSERQDDLPVLVIESPVGLDLLYSHCGLELFTELMVGMPDLTEEWFEAQHQCELRRVAAIADPRLTPVVLVFDDIACRTGTIFNPTWLRIHEIPRLRQLVAAWHAHDTRCLFHSDGNLWLVLADLVATGIDGLNPIETMAGMELGEVRARFPNLFLAGGIDVSELMAFGTPDQVRERCAQALAETDACGYFLGSTTELFNALPLENVLTLLEYTQQPMPAKAC